VLKQIAGGMKVAFLSGSTLEVVQFSVGSPIRAYASNELATLNSILGVRHDYEV